jgi:hypothetical protein
MVRQLAARGFLLVAALVLWIPSEAAGKGFILITHGDTISHLGEVPVAVRAHLPPKVRGAYMVGFKYSSFGVFWVDIWTWGGEYCLYEDKTYWPMPRAVAAQLLNKSERDLDKPWNYTVPPGLIILIGIVVVVILVKVFRKRPEDKVKALFEDPRYQKALEIIVEQSKKDEAAQLAYENDRAAGAENATPPPESDGGFEAAVQHLEKEGVPGTEAQQNLALLLQVLAQAQSQQE